MTPAVTPAMTPAGAALRVTLADGGEVRLHPLSPEDAPRLQAGLQRLSPLSSYRRFGRPVGRLSAEELRYLTEVDQRRHVAWAATDLAAAGCGGIGVARFVQREDRPGTAEIALTVIDAHQRRGLGTLFLALLWHLARAQGLRYFSGQVQADNAPMLAILAQFDARVEGAAGGCVDVSARLPESLDGFPDSALGRKARAAALRLSL